MSDNEEVTDYSDEIRRLVFERGQLKSKLTKFIGFYDKISNSLNAEKVNELENRLINILEIINKFDTIQSQLEYVNKHEFETDERDNFENKYFAIITKTKKIIKDYNAPIISNTIQNVHQQNSQQQNPSHSNHNSIKLPILELPKFNGSIDKWAQFRDLFVTIVHNDTSIDNVRKFYYLSSCLVGEAQKVITSIEITNDNYPIAWDLLLKRFENQAVTIKAHINAILDLPSVSKTGYTLRNLTDDFQTRIRALQVLGEPVTQWDSVLIQILVRKLDHFTETLWDEHLISRKITSPKLNDLIQFLSDRCLLYESRENRQVTNKISSQSKDQGNSFNKSNHNHKKQSKYSTSSSYVSTAAMSCPHCRELHKLYSCRKILALPVASRISIIKQLKVCENCLRSNHRTHECIAQGCKVCNKKHNTILHSDREQNQSINVVTVESSAQETNINQNNEIVNQQTASTCASIQSRVIKDNQIILPTAIIFVQDRANNWRKCRALLDSGSQSNFITENFANILKINQIEIHVPIVGVGGVDAFTKKRIVTSIRSCHSNFSTKLSFLVLNRITSELPTYCFERELIQIPNNILLADNNFNISSTVDTLLGAEIFYALIRAGQIKLGENLPILQETELGWIISGPLSNNQISTVTTCNLTVTKTESIDNQLEKFWSMEEYHENKPISPEEIQCEKIFSETVSRDANNHFIVHLPVKNNLVQFGNSLHNAVKRLKAMERKFGKNLEFKNQYVRFMAEYEELGHMTEIENTGDTSLSTNVFYLPHHGVINQSSVTTKLRVVFDGSCNTDRGIALNDILMVGPTIQEELFDILLRFRKHNYVFTADIAKMYRQVSIVEDQRDLQRVVWRSDSSQAIKHYRLNTVTYGTSAASFLAVRCLQQIAFDNKLLYPEVCDIILHDFYVDDLITGSSTIEHACLLKSQINDLLKNNGFQLRKWASNDTKILQESYSDCNAQLDMLHQESNKILGLIWEAKHDTLGYKICNDLLSENVTKRNILSCVSRIFDPLGLVAPIVVRAKILIQRLWLEKLDWDEKLPLDIERQWINLLKHFKDINSIEISRHILLKNYRHIEIHCFSDASLSAYGACIYVKSFQHNATPQISLLCAKTRVAPIKTITLPRLELCGALLAARLLSRVNKSLNMPFSSVYFWTDSTIVLGWLSSPPSTWKIFVANRVAEILTISNRNQWWHVSSKENPADILSRGMTASELRFSRLWWYGPSWLLEDQPLWPNSLTADLKLPEKRKVKIVTNISQVDNSIFMRFSSLNKLKRIVALCYRFVNNCKNKDRLYGNLTLDEINQAMNALLRLAQRESFATEISCFERVKPIPKESKLISLNPFIDSNGLIRVGGRLFRANISYDRKFPVVLHPKHILTKLIILNEHHKNLHAGNQSILASLRQQYWPLNGRATVRNIIRKCITCYRIKPSAVIQKMSDLPIERVTPNKPFLITGVDLAGPFLIKDSKLRNRKFIKAYLCLFVCFSTRAVHLEPLSDMTTETFLNALKRFTSRRGLCKVIYSDNGTNFVGANNELKDVLTGLGGFHKNSAVENFLVDNQITWNFTPAYSPHHGGLWEAAVKQAKLHIKKVLKNIQPTYEEISTVFAQVEAILNSRPLTPLTNDPNDLSVLTPGHFLIGDSLLTIPQIDLSNVPTNRLNQYQCLQQATQHFWTRWSREYLSLLQQRHKWTNVTSILTPGTMVLLVDDNLPPLYWKLGRVDEIHPGKDGLVRVATVRTPTGLTKRAVQRLCVLPLER